MDRFEFSGGVFDAKWDVIINLGVKCNTLPISRQAGIRYYSSPFDNMDTVEGITQCADMMVSEFDGYFDLPMWSIKNEYAPRSKSVRNKILWNNKYPDVYYPHMAHAWVDEYLSKSELDEWKGGDELAIEPVWEGFSMIFKKRQCRLLSILQSGANVLFLRVDEHRSLKRIHNTNTNDHISYFYDVMSCGFPMSSIGLLYLYCSNNKFPRELDSHGFVHCESVPMGIDEKEYAIGVINKLNVSDRYYIDGLIK